MHLFKTHSEHVIHKEMPLVNKILSLDETIQKMQNLYRLLQMKNSMMTSIGTSKHTIRTTTIILNTQRTITIQNTKMANSKFYQKKRC